MKYLYLCLCLIGCLIWYTPPAKRQSHHHPVNHHALEPLLQRSQWKFL